MIQILLIMLLIILITFNIIETCKKIRQFNRN